MKPLAFLVPQLVCQPCSLLRGNSKAFSYSIHLQRHTNICHGTHCTLSCKDSALAIAHKCSLHLHTLVHTNIWHPVLQRHLCTWYGTQTPPSPPQHNDSVQLKAVACSCSLCLGSVLHCALLRIASQPYLAGRDTFDHIELFCFDFFANFFEGQEVLEAKQEAISSAGRG